MYRNLVLVLAAACTAFGWLLGSTLSSVQAATLPPGFTESVFFSTELDVPTAVRFSPDGRIFFIEKDGRIKVFENLSATTPTLVHDLRTNVNSFLDRGMMGLALHPNFPAIPYIYVLYTYDKDPNDPQVPRWGDTCPDPPGATTDGCVVSGRLSRIELAPGSNVSTGIETVLVEGWGQQFPSHSMDGLMFGPDGALYATAGDGANFLFPDYGQDGIPLNPLGDPPVGIGGIQTPPTAEGGATRTQSLRRVAGPAVLNGTIIRIDPASGAGLPDNPLFASPDVNARRIVGYGFRNPFRFTIRPGTNELWVGDVGWSAWEEINRIPDPLSPSVKNFGWPCYEGDAPQPGYQSLGLAICQNLYNTPGGHTLPYFQYQRDQQVVPGEACPTGNSSIAGLVFYESGTYPAQYQDALFFSDYSRNCIWVMLKGANGLPDPATRQTFASNAGNPVDLQVGPGGDLFYVDVFGALRRIQFSSGNQAPTAIIQPSALSGPLPLNITFDGTASNDPNAGDTLTYSWDLNGDGIFDDATTAQTSFQYTQTKLYNVKLRVTDNHGAAHTASILISAGNTPPTAFIDSPTSGTQWRVGQSITFTGHGTDQEEGSLSASAFAWEIILHHCPSACHAHFLQSFPGVMTASFPAPDHEYPSHLEIKLTVTDAWGLKDTKSLLLDPQTVSLNFDTVPSGLQLVVGGDSSTTPLTKSVILGSNNLIAAVTPQNPGGTTLNFVSWSDGGNQSHFVLGNAAATYIATYSQAGDTIAPSAPAALVANAISGTQIVLSWPAATDNIGVTGYEVERCQGVGCTIFALVATPTTTNFSETGVTPNTSYSYRVRSRDAVGNFSPYTPLSTTTTLATLIDTFDRADNLNLGPAWDPYTGHSPLQLVGNSVRATIPNADNIESYNAPPLPASQWSQATLTGWNGTIYHNAHVAVRLSNNLGSLTGYSGFVESKNQAVIGKWTAGVFSPLVIAPYTPKIGDILRLEAEGTALRFWVNNVQILTTNDTSYLNGRPGLAIYIDAGGTTDQVKFDNFAAGEWTPLTEWQQVDALALNQATQSQGQGILLVGDSLTNRNPLTTLCDRPVIRAGYEGGTWHDVKLRPIWPTVQAQTALVLLGTNDAFKTFPLDAAWLAEVQSFLSILHAHANQVFLVLPPPILPGPNTTPAAIQRIQEIATLLSTLGEQMVDARVIQDPQHFIDGIHLSASGYAVLNSLYGAAACPATDTTPPTAPAALTATPLSETQMAVSWPAATDNVGVTGYEVERCQGAGCTTFALVATPSTPSYGDTGLTADTAYRYQVRARDAAGLVSLYSPIATATTLTPDTTLPLVALTAPADGASVAGLVTVSATASDNVGVAGVQFLLDGSPLGAEALTAPYTLSWNTTTVVNGTHTLAARARDAAGNQATTGAVTVTVFNAVDTTPPTAPATLTATPVSGTQITLNWPAATDNVGVTGYDVERCQGSSCTTFALIATPAATSFGDAGLALGTTYRYQVRARDAAGLVSLYSPIATATTLAATDNFDRADNLNLGAAWDPYASYSPLQLLGNSVRASAVNTDSIEAYTAVPLPNDQWAQATLTGWNGTAYHNAHVNVRLSAPLAALNGYAGLVTSTNKALIAKWTNNALTELAFVPYTAAVGDVLRLEAEGTTLRFYVNNVLRVTATDASYASGRPGLTVYLGAGAALSQVQLDNFSANSLTTVDTTPPDAPAGLTATPLSETQMAVSWPAATDNVGVTGYEVERCQGASCTTFALIASPTATSFGDTGLTADTTYRYQVRARDAAGLVSLYSPIATTTTLTPDTTPPLVALTAPADGASVAGLVTVSATASDNVGVVGVQFLLDGSPLGAEDLTAPYALSWNTTTVVNGPHTLAARARDAAGLQTTTGPITVTVFNAVDTTPPTAPASLTATPVNGTQISLSWPAATDNVGVTGYDVERCQGASCTTFALVATPVATSYGDAGLTLGTTYRYQVRARDAAGLVGLYSPIATATTLAASDNFDRADNLNLGPAWDPYTSYSPLQLLGNSVRASAVNTDSMESYNAVALPNDQWAQATLTGWNGTPYHNAHVNVRLSGTPATLNGYAGLVTSTNKALIAKWTNNVISQLAFVPYTPAVGDVLRLEAEGSTLRFYVNNILRVTATDASYAGGRPGLTVYLDAGAALSQVQLDNFSAGSLSGSGTLPGAPTGLSLTPGTSFRFTWDGVAGATAYRLLEDSTGTGSFAQVGDDLITTSYFHSVALWQRVNAQYVVQACNTSGCTNSAPLAVNSLITNAIGYLKASGTSTGDAFGVALALSTDGNTLAVGAYAEDGIALDSGAAYVFTRSEGIWTQQAYLKASNPGSADSFGVSIALNGDGNTLAVGAYHEDSNATGVNGDEVDNSAPDAGATYVFTRSAGIWSQQAYLKASNTDAGDVFGVSVTLSNDGNTLVVGGYREDSTATGAGGNQTDNSAVDSGAAYVFTRSAGIWSQQAYLKASNTGAGDHFGSWIYLSGDGLTLAVGARFEDSSATGVGGNQADNGTVDSGAVYVFARSGSVWSQEAYLKASNTGSGDLFGAMVTLSNNGNTLAVGARQEDSNATGVGGNQANNSAGDAGAAYVFTRSAGTWSQQAYLKASNAGAGDWFGVRVVLSSDGDTLAVGAQNEGSNAIGVNGNQADNSAPDAGAVYIFRRTSGAWSQETYLKAPNTFTGDLFGDWIGLSADGRTLAVGAQNENGGAIDAGAVYMY